MQSLLEVVFVLDVQLISCYCHPRTSNGHFRTRDDWIECSKYFYV